MSVVKSNNERQACQVQAELLLGAQPALGKLSQVGICEEVESRWHRCWNTLVGQVLKEIPETLKFAHRLGLFHAG